MSDWDYLRVKRTIESIRSHDDARGVFRTIDALMPVRFASFRYWRTWSPGAECLLELSNYPQSKGAPAHLLEGLRRANMDQLAFERVLPINHFEEIAFGTELGQHLALRYQALKMQFGIQPTGFTVVVVNSAREHSLFAGDCEHSADDWVDYFDRNKGEIQLIAQELFLAAARFAAIPREFLTSREKDCLRGAAKGKTVKQIARDLSLSDQTVTFYLGRIRAKLGVSNTTEAVATAVTCGLLDN